ncbi:MAG: M20/M25/M40 family metallo-hydrolase [Verrucomicrobiaceae bacterium]|nr:M20/M25/M40 family metallo-hydrolase [Verrucomicrobiaceae bacterium]
MSFTPALFESAAQRHLDAALAHLRALVEINSFTTHPPGVNAVAQRTAAMFAELGFTTEYSPCAIAGTGDHVFLRREGRGGAPVVLVTHSDTVFPAEEEQKNDFRWDERAAEGRIYGPGVIDNKGGTALIWLMLHALREAAPEVFERTAWLVASNAAEEVTGDDFAHQTTARCPQGARAVLVFEGGPVDARGWHIVASRKGRSTWRLRAAGKAAHAGSQHGAGINAIDALALALPRIAALTDTASERTVNLGFIHGGTVVNRVPHEAEAEWECRATTPAALKIADAFFASLSGPAANGAVLTAERTGFTSPWPGGDEVVALFAHWERAAARMGLQAVAVPRGGLSDANHLWRLGPTLDGLGPSGGNAHCSERSADGAKLPEYLETASLVPKAVMNALALAEMLA